MIEDILVKEEHMITRKTKMLWNRLVKNKEGRGGRLCIITGEQGSGKTTLLRHLAEEYLAQESIVIWRGRPVEQIHWIPDWKDKCVFWHWSNDEFKAYDVRGSVKIPVDDIDVREYKNPPHLINNLEIGKINVVYEPTEFYFTKSLNLADVISKATELKVSKKLLTKPHDGCYIWFELFYLIVSRMNTYWFSILMDESDDIFPETPKGVRWKLQEWAKNMLRDFRKTRTNLILCTHSLNDIDYRIRSKIQFWIYMRNAKIPDTSPIHKKTLPTSLKVGEFIIENGEFGIGFTVPYKQPDMGDLRIQIEPIEKEPVEDEEDEIDEDIFVVGR